MKLNFTAQHKRRNPGFTLIEVVVAVGIVATVFVAFMGLLPFGIDTMRESNSIVTQARIGQKLIGEIQLSQWRETNGGSGAPLIDQFDGNTYLFDEYGDTTESTNDALYTAQIEVNNNPVTLPGVADPDANRFMRSVHVKVAYTPQGLAEENWKFVHFNTVVVDKQKRD